MRYLDWQNALETYGMQKNHKIPNQMHILVQMQNSGFYKT